MSRYFLLNNIHRVKINYIANQIGIPLNKIEKNKYHKLYKFYGILDKGSDQLIVYDESISDDTMEKSLQIISNMDKNSTECFTKRRTSIILF